MRNFTDNVLGIGTKISELCNWFHNSSKSVVREENGQLQGPWIKLWRFRNENYSFLTQYYWDYIEAQERYGCSRRIMFLLLGWWWCVIMMWLVSFSANPKRGEAEIRFGLGLSRPIGTNYPLRDTFHFISFFYFLHVEELLRNVLWNQFTLLSDAYCTFSENYLEN